MPRTRRTIVRDGWGRQTWVTVVDPPSRWEEFVGFIAHVLSFLTCGFRW